MRPSFLLLSILLPLAWTHSATAQEEFLEYYYQRPQPERFVEKMKDWAADGTLENEGAKGALIAFISQVVRQNREKVADWFRDLSGLSQEQKQVFFTGLLYSRTSEADTVMKEAFGEQYEKQKVNLHKILEMPLEKEQTPNMLWGFFYATGSKSAIRRVVECFRFEEAPENPPGVDIPSDEVPLYKLLPSFAFESLAANADRHPVVLDALKEILKDGDGLSQSEKEGVYDVLSTIEPTTYPPIDRSGKGV